MEISVIIPAYNAEETIKKCLDSIFNSDIQEKFEVVIVDDGSTDKTVEIIKDMPLKIIRQANQGQAAARNLGVRNALGNIIIFTDADVIFLKDTLSGMVEHLKKDEVDYVAVRYSKKPANNKWIHRYKALADYCYYFHFIYSPEERQGTIKGVIISGGAEGYKRKAFEDMGGFISQNGGDNVEQEQLLNKLGRKYKMIGDGRIRTMHHFPEFKKLVKDYFYRTFYSMDLVRENNYNQPYLKRNKIRVAMGALSLASLAAAIILYFASEMLLPFWIFLIIFFTYLLDHWYLFFLAYKEYGIIYTLYTLVINLFFCGLISLAGFLGTIRSLIKVKDDKTD